MTNNFTFQGTITNLESKTTKTGKPFSTFTLLASDEGRQININASAFGFSHDRIEQQGEGALVIIMGKLDSNEYQGKHYMNLRINEVHGVQSYEK